MSAIPAFPQAEGLGSEHDAHGTETTVTGPFLTMSGRFLVVALLLLFHW